MVNRTTETQQAIELTRSVVLAQGNIFIRELLRKKNLPIGTSKEEFEANLIGAIAAGKLELSDLVQWLEEVEGWGDQHIYAFRVPEEMAADPLWRSSENVREKLPPAHRKLWRARSLLFPAAWTLTSIDCENGILRYVWHQQANTLLRKPVMDRLETIAGDSYRFRAYLIRPDRSVLRFVLDLTKGLGGVFMQIPAEGDAHREALAMVRETTKPIVEWSKLDQFSASDAIKSLDRAAMRDQSEDAKIVSKRTRLTDAQRYVEFASASDDGIYRSEALRSVRKSVKPAKFAGNTGIFFYHAKTPTNQKRPVTVEMFGQERRVKLRAQLRADEVWEIMQLLAKHQKWGPKIPIGWP
jgi:hypothetical protein